MKKLMFAVLLSGFSAMAYHCFGQMPATKKITVTDAYVGKQVTDNYRDGKNGKEILLYDPLAKAGGKTYSINYFVPSEDGKKMAIGIAEGGAEVATIYILNVDRKTLYPEKIYPSWFGVSGWTQDNK